MPQEDIKRIVADLCSCYDNVYVLSARTALIGSTLYAEIYLQDNGVISSSGGHFLINSLDTLRAWS